MCLILDTCKWDDFLKRKPDMKPVHDWLNKHKGKIITSKHTDIQQETGMKMRKWLKEETKQKKQPVEWIESERVKKAIKSIESEHKLKSNDLSVLGLARAANVKLLCTEDSALMDDFKKTVKKGRVYNMKYKGSYRNKSQIQKQAKSLLTENTCP